MWRRVLFLLLLTGAIVAVVRAVVVLLDRDRTALLRALEAERLTQLEEAAHRFGDELDDLGEDLRFAAGLVARGGGGAEHERELRTLIEVVGQYKAIAVFEPPASTPLIVWDRRVTDPVRASPVLEALRTMGAEAISRPEGTVVASAAVELNTPGEHRVFATAVRGEQGPIAVAVVVDVAPLLTHFQILSKLPETRVLVLGAAGRPTSVSDPALARAVLTGAEVTPELSQGVARMRAHQRGCHTLPESEAAQLGLGADAALLCHLSIRVEGGRPWSAAALSSTRSITAPLRRVALRTFVGAGVVIAFLGILAAYVVLAARRAAALSESRAGAARLAVLNERTQRILDQLPTGVLVLDGEDRVSALNPAIRRRLSSLSVGEPLASTFPRLAAADARVLTELVASARRQQHPESVFGVSLPLFGEPGRFNVHAVPLGSSDPSLQTLLVLEDLSQLSALETQLVRAEKLATIGVLAAGIAHEIGTPLGVIRGRAEYALGKLGPEHAQASSLRVITQQIDQVSGTISQLLDFSRVHPARARPVALAPVVAAVAELLRLEAQRRAMTLEVAIPSGLPLLWAEEDALRQVLVNVILNAFDACRGGAGRVTVEAEEAGSERVELRIRDDGTGIPREQLAQVFDPFFTTKKRGQGTGLGLTIVAQLVRNHGGDLRLESVEGQGTTVRVLWPTTREAMEAKHAAV